MTPTLESKNKELVLEAFDTLVTSREAVRVEAVLGLSARRKSLPSWLFYDATGYLVLVSVERHLVHIPPRN